MSLLMMYPRMATVLSRQLLDEWTSPWTRRRLLRGWDHFGARHFRAVRARLTRLDCPTLIVWGMNDRAHRKSDKRSLLNIAPHAQYLEREGVGHFPEIEDPIWFESLLRQFLHDNDAKPAKPSPF